MYFVWESGQGGTVSAYLELNTKNEETPVVLMKIELESVTKQEEVHNIVVKAGPKSHLLYVTYWRSQIPGLKFLQPFNQNLRELKYFAFDAISFAECFQSSRNGPRFFARIGST